MTVSPKTQSAQNDLAVEIRLFLTLVSKLSMRDLEQRINESLPGTSLLQFGMLRILSREQCTLSELSSKMMLTPSTLVPAVDKLEREGLIVRGKDPQDRRRTPLMLTPNGAKRLEVIPTGHPDDLIVKAVAELGEARARQLHKLLHDLLHHMVDDKALLEETLAKHPDSCVRRPSES